MTNVLDRVSAKNVRSVVEYMNGKVKEFAFPKIVFGDDIKAVSLVSDGGVAVSGEAAATRIWAKRVACRYPVHKVELGNIGDVELRLVKEG